MNTPNRKPLTMKKTAGTLLLAAVIGLGACTTPDAEARPEEPEAHAPTGPLFTVRSVERAGALEASGVAAPVVEATLRTPPPAEERPSTVSSGASGGQR